jgi:hypothetical protein
LLSFLVISHLVLQLAIRDAVAKLDPTFGYADGFDEPAGGYRNLAWARNPPDPMPPRALIVRSAEARDQLKREAERRPGPEGGGVPIPPGPGPHPATPRPQPQPPGMPHRFYGSVEIDMVRPVKAFDAILNAVVMELRRTPDAKVTLTLEIAAESAGGFAEEEVGVVRDNARQLKFKAESTGFGN